MSFSRLDPRAFKWLKAAVFTACLWPLARLVWLAFNDGLGANPIQFIEHTLGDWILIFLVITLSVTPLRRLLNWQWLVRLRRMFGLYAFFYAVLHFVAYIGLDQFFDFHAILKDIVKRPFITVGFACLVLMLPLAATSTNAMVRRLGGRRWQQLHRLVYLIAIGGVIHFWWEVKKDITDPLIYAALFAVLLAIRIGFHFAGAYPRRRRFTALRNAESAK
ncbi:MAG: protein-methionine-sulfoxide reductase heme-binding subunit MsrQ [Burkholderiales bacterium]